MLNSNKLPLDVAFLMEAAGSAPSADNSQPWCFNWDGNTLTCRAHRRGGFPIDYHATKLALGAAAENLVLAMRSLGLDASSWYLGTPKEDGIFAQGSVPDRTNGIKPTNPPLWKLRHTNRLPYCSEIDPDIGQQLAHFQVNTVGVRVITRPGIRQAADWVKQASEIRFQTPEVNEWFAASLRYGNSPEKMTDGLHVNTWALPRRSGIAKIEFRLAPYAMADRYARLQIVCRYRSGQFPEDALGHWDHWFFRQGRRLRYRTLPETGMVKAD